MNSFGCINYDTVVATSTHAVSILSTLNPSSSHSIRMYRTMHEAIVQSAHARGRWLQVQFCCITISHRSMIRHQRVTMSILHSAQQSDLSTSPHPGSRV